MAGLGLNLGFSGKGVAGTKIAEGGAFSQKGNPLGRASEIVGGAYTGNYFQMAKGIAGNDSGLGKGMNLYDDAAEGASNGGGVLGGARGVVAGTNSIAGRGLRFAGGAYDGASNGGGVVGGVTGALSNTNSPAGTISRAYGAYNSWNDDQSMTPDDKLSAIGRRRQSTGGGF